MASNNSNIQSKPIRPKSRSVATIRRSNEEKKFRQDAIDNLLGPKRFFTDE